MTDAVKPIWQNVCGIEQDCFIVLLKPKTLEECSFYNLRDAQLIIVWLSCIKTLTLRCSRSKPVLRYSRLNHSLFFYFVHGCYCRTKLVGCECTLSGIAQMVVVEFLNHNGRNRKFIVSILPTFSSFQNPLGKLPHKESSGLSG